MGTSEIKRARILAVEVSIMAVDMTTNFESWCESQDLIVFNTRFNKHTIHLITDYSEENSPLPTACLFGGYNGN